MICTSCQETLKRMGVTPNYVGYHQTVSAVELARQEPDALFSVTKSLYPAVARPYGTSWKTVERNIRSVISIAWERNPGLIRELVGYPIRTKPSPSQFIASLAGQCKGSADLDEG